LVFRKALYSVCELCERNVSICSVQRYGISLVTEWGTRNFSSLLKHQVRLIPPVPVRPIEKACCNEHGHWAIELLKHGRPTCFEIIVPVIHCEHETFDRLACVHCHQKLPQGEQPDFLRPEYGEGAPEQFGVVARYTPLVVCKAMHHDDGYLTLHQRSKYRPCWRQSHYLQQRPSDCVGQHQDAKSERIG